VRRAARKADPEAARRLRGFARYLADIAGIGSPKSSDAELQRAAEAAIDDEVRGHAAALIVDSLSAAGAGRMFAPYTAIVLAEEE
jgi:hypothetical protein